jgi:hypothetical protein
MPIIIKILARLKRKLKWSLFCFKLNFLGNLIFVGKFLVQDQEKGLKVIAILFFIRLKYLISFSKTLPLIIIFLMDCINFQSLQKIFNKNLKI